MKRSILLIAVLALLVGCSSDKAAGLNYSRVADTREAIRANIEDPAVVGKMLKVMDAFEADVDEIQSTIAEKRAEIVAANAYYNTSNDELEKLYGDIEGQVRKLGATFRDHNFELRALCSAEDWKKIAGDNAALVEFSF